MNKRAIEQTGLIPRSIIRTFERFRKQLFPGAEMLVIQEFRISRYQVIVSVRCLLTLFLVPLLVNIFSKSFLITPIIEYLWNQNDKQIFLNSYQQNRALTELKSFEEKIYFDSLCDEKNPLFSSETSFFETKSDQNHSFWSRDLISQFQTKTFELAVVYNAESIEALSNLFADLVSIFSLSLVFLWMKPQIIILKSFLAEIHRYTI